MSQKSTTTKSTTDNKVHKKASIVKTVVFLSKVVVSFFDVFLCASLLGSRRLFDCIFPSLTSRSQVSHSRVRIEKYLQPMEKLSI